MYYLIENKVTNELYCNRSKDAPVSVKKIFKHSYDPHVKTYNHPLSEAIREYGADNFRITYWQNPPPQVGHLRRYMPALPKEEWGYENYTREECEAL